MLVTMGLGLHPGVQLPEGNDRRQPDDSRACGGESPTGSSCSGNDSDVTGAEKRRLQRETRANRRKVDETSRSVGG